MEQRIETGITWAILILAAGFLIQRPAFGTWQLDVQDSVNALIEEAEEKARSGAASTATDGAASGDGNGDGSDDDQPSQGAAVVTPAATGIVQLAGVDVSHYQGNIDWEDLAEAKISFAFAKATDGITYTDPMWAANKANARQNGILVGGYHFYEPADDPAPQAQNFLTALGDVSGTLPPVVDLEKAPTDEQAAQYAADVLTFLRAIEQATNCTPIIYADLSFYQTYLAVDLSDYPLWLAEYRTTPPAASGPSWVFWQYAQNGFVDGITGAVDLDWFAGDATALAALTC